MAWQEPKTDWVQNPKNPKSEDFNRIEGNIEFLKQDIEAKKGEIVNALNSVGISASINDTHEQIANKVVAAEKKGVVITPGASDKLIPAGIYHDEGYVAGDPDLVAANIKSGVNIFGINGDSNVVDTSGGDAVASDIVKGKKAYAKGSLVTGSLELTGNATAAQVLDKQTFYSSDPKTKQTGTMPNRGAVTITPKATDQVISSGYHNGNGKVVGDANLIAANIPEGKTMFGILGTAKVVDKNLLRLADTKAVESGLDVICGIYNNQIYAITFSYAVINRKTYNSSGTLLETKAIANAGDNITNSAGGRQIVNGIFCVMVRDSANASYSYIYRYDINGTLITTTPMYMYQTYNGWCFANRYSVFISSSNIISYNSSGSLIASRNSGTGMPTVILNMGSNVEEFYYNIYKVTNFGVITNSTLVNFISSLLS